MSLDIAAIRKEFPILEQKIHGRPLVYLDNTATSQTPQRVVDAIEHAYTHTKANVHRGVHTLSQQATDLQERTRHKLRRHINAREDCEVISHAAPPRASTWWRRASAATSTKATK